MSILTLFQDMSFTATGDYSPGDVLDKKYKIQEIIGRGSNGVTYKVNAQENIQYFLTPFQPRCCDIYWDKPPTKLGAISHKHMSLDVVG